MSNTRNTLNMVMIGFAYVYISVVFLIFKLHKNVVHLKMLIHFMCGDVLELPVVAVAESAGHLPLLLFLEGRGAHTACLLALSCTWVQRSTAHLHCRTPPDD